MNRAAQMDSVGVKLTPCGARNAIGGRYNVPASSFAPSVGFHDPTAGLFDLSDNPFGQSAGSFGPSSKSFDASAGAFGVPAEAFGLSFRAFGTAESPCFLDFPAFLGT